MAAGMNQHDSIINDDQFFYDSEEESTDWFAVALVIVGVCLFCLAVFAVVVVAIVAFVIWRML